ncbi:MAG: AgmX/PglI C-terminal domain-containing protein [Bradymonadia bacterium]
MITIQDPLASSTGLAAVHPAAPAPAPPAPAPAAPAGLDPDMTVPLPPGALPPGLPPQSTLPVTHTPIPAEPLWYALTPRGEIGPVPIAQLQELVRQGQVTPADQVRSSEMSDWHVVSDRVDLFQGLNVPQAPATPAPDPNEAPAVGSLGPVGSPTPGDFSWQNEREDRTMIEEIPDDLLDAPSTPAPTPQPPAAGLSGLIDLGQLDALESAGSLGQASTVDALAGSQQEEAFFASQHAMPALTPAPAPQPMDLGTPAPEAPLPEPAPPAPPSEEPDTVLSAPPVPAVEVDDTPTLIPEVPPAPEPAPETVTTPEERKSKKGLWLGLAAIAAIAVLGIVLAMGNGDTPKPGDTAQKPKPGTAAQQADPPKKATTPAPDQGVAAAPVATPDAEAPPETPDAGAPSGPLSKPLSRDVKQPTSRPVNTVNKTPKPKSPTSKKPSQANAQKRQTAPKNTQKPAQKNNPSDGAGGAQAAATRVAPLKKTETRPTMPGTVENLPESLSSQEIAQIMRRQRISITNCYSRHLKREGSAVASRAMLKFMIKPDGRTDKIRLPAALDNTTLKSCLVSLVTRTRFGKFTGNPIPVEYPLVFQAAN